MKQKKNLTGHAVMVIGMWVGGPAAMAQTCHYSEVNPGTGKVSVGQLSIDLGHGDGTNSPSAWLGPVRLTRSTGESCSVDPGVSIIERPLYTNGQQLLIATYSGSEQVVYAVDAATCKVQWKSESFSGRVKLSGVLQLDKRKLKLGSNCLP